MHTVVRRDRAILILKCWHLNFVYWGKVLFPPISISRVMKRSCPGVVFTLPKLHEGLNVTVSEVVVPSEYKAVKAVISVSHTKHSNSLTQGA